jgi:HK97 family phage major capsid protein
MSKKLKELRQRQHDLKAEATALLDKADVEGRDLTDAEETRFSAIEAELATVNKDIAAEERIAERRRAMDAIPTVPANSSVTDEPNPATTNGFQNIAEFATAVRTACTPETRYAADPRLTRRAGPLAAPTNYHEGGGASGEGFELPAQFRDQIWELVMGMEGLINGVDLEPTSARQVDYTADESTPWGSTGVQAYWRSEGGQMTASKQATKGRSMSLHELYAFVLATEELLEDAPRLSNRLSRKAAEAIGWKIDDAIIYGTGAGQPLGWFNSGALVSVAKESSQTADTINAQNVLKMYSRLLVAPGDTPFWLANRDTVPQLSAITIGDKPAWLPPNGLIDAPGGFLLGYPIKWSEHCKTLGDKGDLQLVSPKGYYAARRTAGVQFASSMHLYFDYNIQAFRWTFRFGGQPHLSAAVSPANGSATKSHFVVLDDRA